MITSLHNQRVKDAARLRDRRQRQRQDRIVIDGARELQRALDAGIEPLEAFVCEALCHSDDARRVLARLAAAAGDVWQVTPPVFQKLAFGDRAEGVLAVAQTPRRTLADLQMPPDALVAVVEAIEKPGNLGAVLRSADAAGVAAVIAAGHGTDLYNPNAIRASLGTVFTVPVCAADTAEIRSWLQRHAFSIYAARPEAQQLYTDVRFAGPTALVLGSESAGLSDVWRSHDVTPIKLPMQGRADSLNISVAAAVLFYEALRQRGQCVHQ
ncbi:MAG TPA: TrmH family RNA methyltransferase [Pirellulales bacterium]